MRTNHDINKLYYIFIILINLSTTTVLANEYKVTHKLASGDYIINGIAWRPQTTCPHINQGDKVVFTQGNANGNCVAATISKQSKSSSCQLWCNSY